MGYRFANALILLALIALTVFLITFRADQADWNAFFLGAGLAILGLLIRARTRPPRQGSPRARALRRLLGDRPEEEE